MSEDIKKEIPNPNFECLSDLFIYECAVGIFSETFDFMYWI